ncbi:MAG: orotidine-5'-phosphate decarboxylase [Dehalococcoidia bacterium]|nr:orotidine-5'-phosphate decarboxylase [Dehalococcoidia bacterium]
MREASERNSSLLCVGLDPDPAELNGRDIAEFGIAIIDATIDLVCAYKPNLAFYEAHGSAGYAALERIIDHVNGRVPVLGDAKRNDIGNSVRFYAKGLFETMGFDAVTVNPFLGRDSLQPFLDYEDKGVFILCRTSNPGGADIQGLNAAYDGVPMPLYEAVAHMSKSWDTNGNIGLVTGATYPSEAQRIREICPDMPFLVPGVGTQGGELEAALSATLDADGGGILVNSSRGILYASTGSDFAEAARVAAENLRAQIEAARPSA